MGNRKRKNKNQNQNNNTALVVVKKKPKFHYTPRLEAILLDIGDNISFAIMGSYMTENDFGYKLLDMSDKPGTFRAQVEDKGLQYINIYTFVESFFDKKMHPNEIHHFIVEYNKRIPLEDTREYFRVKVTPFEEEEFVYKPLDPYYTFASLCYKTYPHGTEEKCLKYMPVDGLTEDNYGNYYVKVGESDTMFTSHLDSACRQHETVQLLTYEENKQKFVITGGKSILSADDKAGVTVMLYMIANNVPGLYYFFLGEERGGIGSGLLASDFHLHEHLKGINKCVSFDRRNYHSVITHQGSRRCCSDAFANSLCDEFNKHGLTMKLDNGGLFTDSANFIEHIMECTNVSVGYFREHSVDEIQNITFLRKLCTACVKVNWSDLHVRKQPVVNKEVIEKNTDFLMEFRQLNLYCDAPMLRAFENKPDSVFIEVKLTNSVFGEAYHDVMTINTLIKKYYENNNVVFEESNSGELLMNIELT